MPQGELMRWDDATVSFRTHDDRPRFDEPTARRLFRDMVEGIAYLHARSVIHRDIKPQNMLVEGGGRCKISCAREHCRARVS